MFRVLIIDTPNDIEKTTAVLTKLLAGVKHELVTTNTESDGASKFKSAEDEGRPFNLVVVATAFSDLRKFEATLRTIEKSFFGAGRIAHIALIAANDCCIGPQLKQEIIECTRGLVNFVGHKSAVYGPSDQFKTFIRISVNAAKRQKSTKMAVSKRTRGAGGRSNPDGKASHHRFMMRSAAFGPLFGPGRGHSHNRRREARI